MSFLQRNPINDTQKEMLTRANRGGGKILLDSISGGFEMKKVLVALLALAIVFTFASCKSFPLYIPYPAGRNPLIFL